MSTVMDDVLAAIRRPEYTGENRCLPCTLVNAAIAIVIAVVVGLLVPFGSTGSAAVAAAVLLVAAAAIALRGYLVPGTPWLTRTYLPDRVLRYFEHGRPTHDADSTVEPAVILAEAGAVTECEDVDDLCLTEDFRAAWYDRMDDLRGADASRQALASMLDVPLDRLDLEEYAGAYVALVDGGSARRHVGQWESPGAFLADMAAARVLDGRVAGWSDLAPAARGQVLSGLRVFLDRCPTCGGEVAFGEETVESCCRSKSVVAVTCEDCDARLFEADQPDGEAA